VRDSVGNLLADGDQVTLIKDLTVKGAGQTLKRGTLIKSIRLTGDPQEIDCKYEGIKGLVLRAEFVRKRAESKDPDDPARDADLKAQSRKSGAPVILKAGAALRWLYAHSLGSALLILFILSFVLHWTFSAQEAAAEAASHGEPALSTLQYLASAQLWFESFQNWQSRVPVDSSAGRAEHLPAPARITRVQGRGGAA
jgi:hypothetical protein